MLSRIFRRELASVTVREKVAENVRIHRTCEIVLSRFIKQLWFQTSGRNIVVANPLKCSVKINWRATPKIYSFSVEILRSSHY